jgi:hypothetical protein
VRLYQGQKLEDALGVRDLPDGKKSIAMVGVNCTFCHSNEIKLGGKTHFMEGAPNMLNIRGFFQDMFASTAKTMLTPELLEEFLRKNNVAGDLKATAETFSSEFKKELGLTGLKQEILGRVLNRLDSEFYNGKKTQTLRRAMFENRIVVENRLLKLLQMTYGLKQPSNELRLRMRFLSASIGIDPDLATTPEGFARTDAHGDLVGPADVEHRVPRSLSLERQHELGRDAKHRAVLRPGRLADQSGRSGNGAVRFDVEYPQSPQARGISL